MSDSNTLQLGGLGAAAIALLGYMVWSKHFSSRLPLPPSPKSYPLIGNLLSMPTKDQHLGFTEIGKHLKNEIISLSTLGNTIIVLNNAEDATNLLEKRSGIYSDRICPPMIRHPSLMAWENHPALIGYGPRWKTYRRLMQPWLHKEAAKKFEPSQQHQARLFLQKLLKLSSTLELSADLGAEANSALAATIAYSSYGYQVNSSDDPFLLRIQTLIDNTNYAVLPSNFLVNLFPTLASLPEWLPGMGWKRLAKEWRIQKDDAIDGSYEWAKSHMKNGNNDSIVALMFNHCQRLGMSPDEAEDCGKNIALLLYAGGVETTASAYLVFIVAMILYPEVQKRAHQEIDSVIGSSRLPTMEDRENLPYINRLIQELFRWYPTLPLGVPHVCYKDDEYKGYRIPKGAYVIGNIWAITRNAAVYEDPETFEPDRFLDPSVPPAPNFGFGRRICPGLHYAGASFFILITSTLAAFDIKMYKDQNGNNIVPSPNSENTIIHHPKPFKLKLKSRSEAHEVLIRAGT